MGVARSLCVLAGVITAFGAALWMGAIAPLAGVIAASWAALTIVHALAMATTAVLAVLVTAAGALLAADWRADFQSHQAWAQVNIAAAELKVPVVAVARGDLDPRYLPAVDNQALGRIFEARRFVSRARMLDSAERASPSTAAASWVDLTGQAAQAARAVAGIIPAVATRVMGYQRKAAGAERVAVRARLVVNGNARLTWPRAECIVSPTAPQRHAADVIVLGSRPDDQARPLPEASVGGDIAGSTGPASCRGPPQRERQSFAVGVAPKLSRERAPLAPGAGKWPAADPIARDDLGDPVPVHAAELDVIETYLDQMLRELLGSSTAGSEQQQS
ncbi:MAG: hypothetical protein F9K29_15410 [Hyphomicrobiaceae bacterium]|nr:MAG: hypothetical protein F9K29_15410 [Hyphomicrobiaceae bacterium]